MSGIRVFEQAWFERAPDQEQCAIYYLNKTCSMPLQPVAERELIAETGTRAGQVLDKEISRPQTKNQSAIAASRSVSQDSLLRVAVGRTMSCCFGRRLQLRPLSKH